MINSFKTLFEARERKFQQEKLFRGESVDLVAKITTDGVMDELSDYSISGVYQATGDNPEGKTYTLSAEIKDGAAILHWTNENDFGANSYNVWGLLEKDGRAAYPIAWRLNFASSPSYPLDEIDLLVRTINFDNYELLNAPFLYLSGGTMDEGASIGFPISGDIKAVANKDGLGIIEEKLVETEPMSGYCWHTIPDPVPDYEIQWYTQTELDNWSEQHPGETKPSDNVRLRLCATKPAETHTEVSSIVSLHIPSDEEGDKTFATREWAQEKVDAVEEKLGDYLPLSGGTISGDFAVENFLSGTDRGVFLGKNQDLDQYAELAIGNNLSVGMVGLAIGSNSEAQNNGITIGHSAKSPYGGGNIVIGNGASTAANGTTVVGTNAKASGGNAIAIGTAANATHNGEVRLGGPQGNLQPQLWLFETPVISGPDARILPERIPYLNDYQTKSDAAAEHTQLSNDLTAWVEEHIPQPTGPLAPLTIKQNGQTLVEYHPDYNTPQEALIVVPTNVSDLEGSEDLVNQDGLSSVLSDYATNSYVNSSFNNARSYTDEQIDQLSDVYVKKDDIDFLSTDYAGLPDLNNISLFDISHKLNFCIQAISGKKIPHGNLPPDAEYTYVVMADGTQLLDDGTELSDIQEGTLDAFAQHNGYSGANDIRAVVLGSGVEAVGHHAFAGFENLEMVDISRAQITLVEDRTFQYSPMLRYVDLGTSISAIGSTVFQHSYNLTELTLPESLVSAGIWSFNNGGIEKLIFSNRTKAQVQAMANYPWQMGGCTMVATDETWIA